MNKCYTYNCPAGAMFSVVIGKSRAHGHCLAHTLQELSKSGGWLRVKKYRVELCYSLYATPFEVEATDARDATEKATLAFNQTKGTEPSLDLSSLNRWRDADMIEEVKEDGSEKPNNPEGP